jgi:hypothetical protein
MNIAEAARIQSYEETMRWPTSQAIGAAGVALVSSQLLQRKILPCTPMIDIGYDIVTAYGNLMKRAQIKATQVATSTKNNSTPFCVKRNKGGYSRNGAYMPTPSRGYAFDEIDVFIFAHIDRAHFYIVPASEIDLNRHKLSLSPDSKWADAWWVLKTP